MVEPETVNSTRYPLSDPAAHFPQTRFHLAHQRHAERPAELHGLDVFADRLAILAFEVAQPVTHRLIARRGGIEVNLQDRRHE